MDPQERPGKPLQEPGKRQLIGTIELIATLVVTVAVIALIVWFLLFAHDPLLH